MKYAAFLLLLIPVLVLAQAPAPPSGPTGYHPAGPAWGQDPTNWVVFSDPWESPWLLYDYSEGYSSGYAWRAATDDEGELLPDPLPRWLNDWPGLNIEVWFEMEATFDWNASHVQIHRAGDYSDLDFYFTGHMSTNNGQYIITTPPPGLATGLTVLPYIGDQFNLDPSRGFPIPLTWYGAYDSQPWTLMALGAGGARQFQVPACDHTIFIRVVGDVAYHQPDGYYQLTGGSLCPAEPL